MRIALVTGANRGIGLQIAQRLMDDGYIVYLGTRDIANLPSAVLDLPNSVACEIDTSDLSSIKKCFQIIRKQHKKLDVMVNNAGIMQAAMIATTTTQSLDKMIETNLKGAFYCAQMASRLMIAQKSGSIINISSIIGTQGAAGFSAYSMSKSALLGMTKSMAKELAVYQIRVNAIAPGFIETDLTANTSEDDRTKTLNNIGMKRFGTKEDVAALAHFLSSDVANYITGQIIGIDGGMSI